MGGEAKWRKAEIEELKRRSPEQAAQWRQLQNDKRRVASGIDPSSPNSELLKAMVRALGGLFNEAKRTGNVDPPITFLHATVNATMRGLKDIPVACKNGCSHCCHTWVSVSAAEALYVAKIVRQRGDAAIEKVLSIHRLTKEYDFHARDHHPYPCPLLEDNACSIYESRPKVCRFAGAPDADVCARAYHNITNENVQMPVMYLTGRSAYALTMAVGLRHAKLPSHAYEFNGALARALETDQAEQRWLAGQDIFDGIHRDPADVRAEPQAQWLYDHSFGNRAEL